MSGGGVSRVSIPKSVNKTIQDIKEIAQNHSDEEIYAMLKDCSMDPNETAQKLLLQDTFHEVKRKRDKRKENMSNRETADSRWRTGTQGRGGRGGRGIFSPRHPSHDAGSGRNASAGKENGVNQMPESVVATASAPATVDADNKGPTPVSSSATGMANGPANAGSSTQSRGYSPEEPANVVASKLAGTPQQPSPPPHVEEKSVPSSGVNVTHGKHTPSADQVASPVSVLGVYSSASDPVLVPSLDSRLPAAVGTIKREVRSQRTGVEHPPSVHADSQPTTTQDFTKLFQTNKVVPQDATASELASMNVKAAPEIGNSFGKMPSRAQGFEKNQASESLQHPSSSSHGGNSTSRPSSNYGSRSQQPVGSQKAVGPNKEWKPKPTNQTSAPASGTTVTSEVSAITVEAGAVAGSLAKFGSSVSEESKSKLQHKLEELQLSHSPHVIIPNHLQVPESERTRLSFGFGSFDADFGVKTSHVNEPETDKSTTPLSESSQGVDEASEEPPSSNQNAPPNAQEGDYPDNPQSPVNVAENLSPVEADVPSGAVPEFDQSNKSEAALPQGASQYSIVHTTPSYNFGLMPTVLGTQFAPFDSSEPQARDMSRLPSFVVPQYDPSTSYFFRPSTDGDGRFSPFLAPGAVTKYNGNVVSPQSGQPSQESGNSLVLSAAGPTPLVTQAAGVMQSSLAVNQPTVTFFRQPSGVHLPPYHPNYMPPFSQYIPPFYGFPTFHPLISNTAFPQQTTGNVYPPPAAAASAGVKYPYKPGTNTSNSTHVGTPTGYPQYNSTPTGYSPNPAASTGNSTGNEDVSASQFKENNVYISGQQSEGSTVWIPTPGREVSGLQPNSFYNPSPHAQHVTYAPTQAGHGAYAGMYHPAQTVAAGTPHPLLQQSQTMAGPVEMVGPPGGLYQQPQRAQMNWTGNY